MKKIGNSWTYRFRLQKGGEETQNTYGNDTRFFFNDFSQILDRKMWKYSQVHFSWFCCSFEGLCLSTVREVKQSQPCSQEMQFERKWWNSRRSGSPQINILQARLRQSQPRWREMLFDTKWWGLQEKFFAAL